MHTLHHFIEGTRAFKDFNVQGVPGINATWTPGDGWLAGWTDGRKDGEIDN